MDAGRIERKPFTTHANLASTDTAGRTIGMWDNQKGEIPKAGDFPASCNDWIMRFELNAVVFVKEWNKDVRIYARR